MRQKLKFGISGITVILTMTFFIAANLAAGDKLNIVTSTTDLASIAREIGGEYVEVFSIAEGYQDPHFVDAKPSFIMKLQKADMFMQVGLDLEIGWVPTLLDGSRNADILPSARGYVDASAGIPLLQVPVGDPATLRAEGDIHASGNPHYWLDPLRGKIIAQNIFNKLLSLQPANRAEFQKNLERFNRKIDVKVAEWQEKLKPYAGAKIVAFHNSWPYFEERFGLNIVTFIEPKPGIPPTPKYLVEVIKIMTGQNIKAIIISPYYSKKSSQLVASKVAGEVVELASSVNAFPEVKNYFDLFDYNINKLIEAFNRNSY
jgi:ABC-type Zn uptake system ZnuABC Zn-binding protein ZnuA